MSRKDKPLSPDNMYDRYGRRRRPEKPVNRVPTPKLPDWIPPARLPANALPKRSYTGNIAVAGEGSLVPEAYGRVMIRSPRIFAIGYVNDWYWLGALWCKGEINLIESIYNRNKYWLGSANSSNHNQYLGDNIQNVDPKLASWITGYADNMRGYAYTAIGFHHTLMVDVSSLSAIVQGKLIYDPRTTSTGYSSNFALMFRDVAVSQGLSVDDDNIADAADFNDELLGGEKRRWGGLYFDKQDTVDKQLQVIAEHAGCFYVREAGVAKIIPDAPSTSVYIFSDVSPISNIVEGSLKLAKKSIDNIPNQCTVEYLSNIKIPWRTSYAETPLPGGEIRTTTYRLPGFQSYAVAYRHAVERQNRFNLIDLSIEFETFDEALEVEEGDVITVTHNVGIVSKPFRATNVKASRFTGSWIIQAEEYDPAVYSDVIETEPTYPDFDLPYPYPVPQPNEPVLSCNSINDQMWIAIDWASLGGAYPFPHYYEVALYNVDADPVLVLLSQITDSDISVGPVVIGSSYQIIITTVNFAAVRSIDRVVEFMCVVMINGVEATSGVGEVAVLEPFIHGVEATSGAGEVIIPIYTSEIVVVYDGSFDDLEVWSFDHTGGPSAQLLNMDVQLFNSISAMTVDPSGKFLFLSAGGGDLRQWAWDGTSFYELYNGGTCGTNEVNWVHIKETAPGVVYAVGSGSGGSGICAVPYFTSASPTTGYEFSTPVNFDQPIPLGPPDNYCKEIEIIGDWRDSQGPGSVGSRLLGLAGEYCNTWCRFTASGTSMGLVGYVKPTPLGAWGIPWGKALVSWDRDSGVIVASGGSTANPGEVHAYQATDSAHPNTFQLLWANASAWSDEPICLTMCNDYVVAVFKTTPTEIRTYSVGGSGLTLVDNVAFANTGWSIYSEAFTSPYTNKVYFYVGNVYCYGVDSAGLLTYHGATNSVGSGNGSCIAFFPVPFTPHIDTTVFWNSLESYWDMDELDPSDRYGAKFFEDSYSAGITGELISAHAPDTIFDTVMIDGMPLTPWSYVKTTDTEDPVVSSGYLIMSGGGPLAGGVWPGAITFADFGVSDADCYSYVKTGGTGDSVGVVMRYQDIDNFIYAYIEPITDSCVLAKVESGVETVLDSATFPITMNDGGNYYIRLWMYGSYIKAWVETFSAKVQLSATSTFLQTSTKHGQYLRGLNGLPTAANWFRVSPFPYPFTDNTITPDRTGSNLQYSSTDKAAAFTADNMSLVTTGTPFDSTGSFQVGMMVDFTSTTGSQCTLMCKGDSITGDVDWHLGHTGTAGSWFWKVRCGGTLYSVEIPTAETPRSTEWTFVTAYYDAGSNEIGLAVRTYYNSQSPYEFQNVYETTAVGGTRNNDHSTMMLGSRTIAAAEPTVGGIDKVFYYSRVLSHDEWLWLANYGVRKGRRFAEFSNKP